MKLYSFVGDELKKTEKIFFKKISSQKFQLNYWKRFNSDFKQKTLFSVRMKSFSAITHPTTIMLILHTNGF